MRALSQALPSFLRSDPLGGAGLWLLLLVSLSSMPLLALAALGQFRPLPLAAAALAVLLAAGAVIGLVGRPSAHLLPNPAARWEVPGLLAVLIIGAVLVLPPGEFVLGGWDPGVYFSSAVSLAQSGGLGLPEHLRLASGPAFSETFVARLPGLHPYLQPGFFWDQGGAQAVTQFPFLFTAWAGVAAHLAGPAGALYTAPVIFGLALLYFFLLARQLLGSAGGLAAVALLAFNAVQVWHGRLSFSEELLQALCFGGLWAGLRWRAGGSIMAGVAGGLALGLLPLVKLEGVVLTALAVAGLARLAPGHRETLRQPFWAALAGALLFTALYWGTAARLSVLDQFGNAWGFLALGVALVAAMVAAPALWGMVRTLMHAVQPRLKVPGVAPLIPPGLAVLAAGFTYAEAQAAPGPTVLGALWDGLYLSPLDGLLLAFLALAGRGNRGLLATAEAQVVLGVLAAASVLYLAIFFRYVEGWDRIPLFMWATRRLLPAPLPLLALLEAAAALSLVRLIPRSSAGSGHWPGLRGLALALAALALVLARWNDLAPVAAATEYQGAARVAVALARDTEADAVFLLDGDEAGIRFALPLYTLAGRLAFIPWNPEQATEGTHGLLREAQRLGQQVYYLSSQPGRVPPGLERYGPELVRHTRVRIPELERTSLHRPTGQASFYAHLALFRLGDGSAQGQQQLPLIISLGTEEFQGYQLLRRGFYPGEELPDGAAFRWTAAEASIALPPDTRPQRVALRLASGRPDTAGAVPVEIACGEGRATVQATAGFAESTVELSEGCLAPGQRVLTLRTTPWSPAAAGMALDTRSLGIMLSSVTFQ